MKKTFFIALISLGLILGTFRAQAAGVCAQRFSYLSFDVFGAIGRGLSTAVKYFLTDDQKLTAKLVFEGEQGRSGGCGGAYTGDKGSISTKLVLNAVASSVTDIPAEFGAYPSDIKIQETSIGKLADLRTREIMKGQASLDELSADKWAIEYRAQQRAIQAMTDALVMKKTYAELAAIAEKVSSGSYTDYSDAASTVATRRLILDALMVLRKRVIAARVRARAETMEADIDTTKIPTQAIIDESALQSGPEPMTPQNAAGENNTPSEIENYGLGDDKNK